jgi:hypothetical protein
MRRDFFTDQGIAVTRRGLGLGRLRESSLLEIDFPVFFIYLYYYGASGALNNLFFRP